MKFFTLHKCALVLLLAIFSCDAKKPGSPVEKKADTSSVATPVLPVSPDSTDAIAEIREAYNEISSKIQNGSLQADTLHFSCEDDPLSGYLIKRSEGSDLVMLHYTVSSEHSWQDELLYYKNNRLFFALVKSGSWYFSGTDSAGNPETEESHREDRYYLHDGLVIKKLTKSYKNSGQGKKTHSNQVPNKELPVSPGERYPETEAVDLYKNGKSPC